MQQKGKGTASKPGRLNLIKIIEPDPIPKHWSEVKRKRAQEFLEALKEAKLAEEGKIELKSAQSLLDEL